VNSSAAAILDRDLQKLSEELKGYADESLIWKVTVDISNSAGNLCLHVCGNLQHFIGATLGGSGYVRNREAEFALKNIPRDKLLEEIETTRQSVRSTIESLDRATLEKNFPLQVDGQDHSTEFFLIHLAAHLNYHLGQVNYHRRLVK
jgi:uncharacterized damage-inducible protein DinB